MNEVTTENSEDFSRDSAGRFRLGTRGGPGNPAARHARELRARLDEALFKACAPDRLLAVIDALLRLAEAGDVPAARLLLDRVQPADAAVDLRIKELEAAMLERAEM
jgi:hypothetical protein